LARLAKGNLNDVLTMGSALPAWSAPSSGGVWTSLIQQYDQNAVDTGYVDCGGYRWIDVFVSGAVTGTEAIEMQFYTPDGSLGSVACMGTGGFYIDTHYANGNQTKFQITFGQTMVDDPPNFGFGMRLTCSPVGKPSGGLECGNYWFSKRESYDCTFCQGNLYFCDGFTDADLNFFNGFKFITNGFTDVLVSAYGAGDNTS